MKRYYLMFLAVFLLSSSIALADMMGWNSMMGSGGYNMMGGFLPFSFGGGLFGLSIAVIWVLAVIFWIWMLIDAITRKFNDNIEKLIWILVIIFVHIIGALIYYFIIKAKNRTSAISKSINSKTRV